MSTSTPSVLLARAAAGRPAGPRAGLSARPGRRDAINEGNCASSLRRDRHDIVTITFATARKEGRHYRVTTHFIGTVGLLCLCAKQHLWNPGAAHEDRRGPGNQSHVSGHCHSATAIRGHWHSGISSVSRFLSHSFQTATGWRSRARCG
jgi:hypothetical protein